MIIYGNKATLKCATLISSNIFQMDGEHSNAYDGSPSLLLTFAKTGPWLLVSWEELLNDDGGRLATSGLSHTSVDQSQSRKRLFKIMDSFIEPIHRYFTESYFNVKMVKSRLKELKKFSSDGKREVLLRYNRQNRYITDHFR